MAVFDFLRSAGIEGPGPQFSRLALELARFLVLGQEEPIPALDALLDSEVVDFAALDLNSDELSLDLDILDDRFAFGQKN